MGRERRAGRGRRRGRRSKNKREKKTRRRRTSMRRELKVPLVWPLALFVSSSKAHERRERTLISTMVAGTRGRAPRETASSAAKRREGHASVAGRRAQKKNGIALLFPPPRLPASPFSLSLSPDSMCSLCRVRGLTVDACRIVGRATVGAAQSRRAREPSSADANANAAGTAAAAAALLGRGVIDQPLVAEEADLVVALAQAQAELSRVEMLGAERALERVDVYEDHIAREKKERSKPSSLAMNCLDDGVGRRENEK